jgi:hypothetical protein
MAIVLDMVDDLLALVVPASGIALRVLVREDRPRGLQDRFRDVVLGRDQSDLRRLTLLLCTDQRAISGSTSASAGSTLVITLMVPPRFA